jgi:hypothetical protein
MYKVEIPLVYSTPVVLVNHVEYKDGSTLSLQVVIATSVVTGIMGQDTTSTELSLLW